MKKLITGFLFIFIIWTQASCTQKTVFFTSEFSGYVYDNKTKLPLKNKLGYIGVNGILSDPDTKLDANGKFFIPAKTEKYYLKKPPVDYANSTGDLFFSFPNYQTKRIEYVDLYVDQVPEDRAGFDHLNKIDVGIIYLDPE